MNLKKLRAMGYAIGAAMFEEDDSQPTVYFVSGPGVEVYVSEADHQAWASLEATEVHQERVLQVEDPDRATELTAAAHAESTPVS